MQTKIHGTALPVLEIALDPGEKIVAETGALSWMTEPVSMHTATGGSRGIWRAAATARARRRPR